MDTNTRVSRFRNARCAKGYDVGARIPTYNSNAVPTCDKVVFLLMRVGDGILAIGDFSLRA
jgi:hypothetical protein